MSLSINYPNCLVWLEFAGIVETRNTTVGGRTYRAHTVTGRHRSARSFSRLSLLLVEATEDDGICDSFWCLVHSRETEAKDAEGSPTANNRPIPDYKARST